MALSFSPFKQMHRLEADWSKKMFQSWRLPICAENYRKCKLIKLKKISLFLSKVVSINLKPNIVTGSMCFKQSSFNQLSFRQSYSSTVVSEKSRLINEVSSKVIQFLCFLSKLFNRYVFEVISINLIPNIVIWKLCFKTKLILSLCFKIIQSNSIL